MRTIAKFLALVLLATACLTAGPSHPVEAAGGRVALVIGNGAYRLHDPLPTAKADVGAVAAALRSLDFDVIEAFDASNGSFRAALNTFSERLRPGDVAVFYFMGYAVQVKGRNFLLPIGAELRKEFDLLTRGVALDAVRHLMEAAGTRANVILLDASYADRISATQAWASAGLGEPARSAKTLTVYSVWPGNELAPPSDSEGSLFSRELSFVLNQPVVDLRDAVRAAVGRVEVTSGAEQRPWIDPTFTSAIRLAATAVATVTEPQDPAPEEPEASQPPPDPVAQPDPIRDDQADQPVPSGAEPGTESAGLPDATEPQVSEPVEETETPEQLGRVYEATLSRAQRGRIQQDLRTLEFYKGGVDRAFGPGTRQGIRRLQSDLGEPQTGYLTESQAAALTVQAERRREEIKVAQAQKDEERRAAEARRKAEEEEARKKAASDQAKPQQQAATQPKRQLSEVERVIRLAENGDSRAQANLGVRYFHGRGVEKDYAKARFWYLKAAEQGETSAQTNLGFIYFNGYGVPKDLAEAAKWLRAAAEQGQREAQYNLGMLYENGSGVPRDYSEAAKWYQRAAERGIDEASRRIDALKQRKLIQ